MTDPLQLLFIGISIIGIVVGGGAFVLYRLFHNLKSLSDERHA